MSTVRFEASLILGKDVKIPSGQAVLAVGGRRIPALLRVYEKVKKEDARQFFVRVSTRSPVALKWKDPFEVLDVEGGGSLACGVVLNPLLPERSKSKKDAGIDFLQALSGSEEEMLAGLSREKGTGGLREQEIKEFSGLSEERIVQLAEKLEEEGKVKIIAFSPLYIIFQESFDFLGLKILAFLEQIRDRHPAQKGVALARIKKRYELNDKVLALAVKTLEKKALVDLVGQRIALHSHKAALSPQEEKILQRLEEKCLRGEFQSVSMAEIQRELRVSSERLERLLSLLTEKEKIIPGPDGLYIHARWLDEIVGKVRSLGQKELTVQEFKAMTGLSRKYAIPLLELLDQMGVTRRKGPLRVIL